MSEPQKSEPQKSEPQNGRGALFAGGLAAILASACCLGPLVLIALGFSGAWIGNLTVLEPYRPIFIGAALVALFFAWRRIYRPAQACKPGEVCAIPQVRATWGCKPEPPKFPSRQFHPCHKGIQVNHLAVTLKGIVSVQQNVSPSCRRYLGKHRERLGVTCCFALR